MVTIAERPDLAPLIADWLWNAFWAADGYSLWEVEEQVAGSVARFGPEQCFVLLRDGVPIGTASLAFQDLEERPDLTPWLAGVFVVPEERGQGLVLRLLDAVEGACRSAGIASLWLYTSRAERIYARAGWRTVEIVERRGRPPAALMHRDLG